MLSVIRLLSIDELLLQMVITTCLMKCVDAQVALIEEMENLLDVAETLVVEKELRVTRSLLELPI
ncbi:hypothetical protein QJS10_CPB20g01063 [Acorus calamus]|uniref:Uncharacterized protein n=1 Tax=Acorus calamus TaxID=4465 RepID=A0AAV9CAQ2_ACOCL|nr:hypothetical protein QJS10_CPB20g01063 [Acorus calamus]